MAKIYVALIMGRGAKTRESENVEEGARFFFKMCHMREVKKISFFI